MVRLPKTATAGCYITIVWGGEGGGKRKRAEEELGG